MVRLLAGHDLSHLHQISRYIQAIELRSERCRDRTPTSRSLRVHCPGAKLVRPIKDEFYIFSTMR
jgi:hypothetical protein